MLHVRCGPTGPVSDEDPIGRSNPAAEAMPRSRSPAWASDWRGRRAAARTIRSCSEGLVAWCLRVRSTSSAPAGLGPGLPTAARGCSGGRSSNITVIRSVAETPSTMQWWTLESSAQRFSLSPSIIQISHSGLRRSRCWAKIRAAVWRSTSSVAGARKRAVPQVVGEVEVRILDPHRAPETERDEADLLPVARNQAELARDHLLEALERRRGPLEDAHAADVHRVVGPLDVEERCVHRAHPVHWRSSSRTSARTL